MSNNLHIREFVLYNWWSKINRALAVQWMAWKILISRYLPDSDRLDSANLSCSAKRELKTFVTRKHYESKLNFERLGWMNVYFYQYTSNFGIKESRFYEIFSPWWRSMNSWVSKFKLIVSIRINISWNYSKAEISFSRRI